MMEPLSDPLGDRIVKTVTPPPHRPLTSENIFAPQGTDFKDPSAPLPVDWKLMMKNFQKNGRLSKEATIRLLRAALEVFRKEENIVKVPDPVVFVGDIHGQFFDLVKMLDLVGKIGDLNFVFLGDYVDRGMFAFEVVATLYALKLCYPNKITLLRGNHECR
jgi:serine/threonine-protein phosphatase 2B catalytic subunit